MLQNSSLILRHPGLPWELGVPVPVPSSICPFAFTFRGLDGDKSLTFPLMLHSSVCTARK